MAALWLTAVGVAFSGAIMPGPVLTYTIKQSFTSGAKAGFLIMIGHALLEIALIALIFLGFDVILQSDAAQIIIGIVGGLLLVYLGGDMIRSSVRNKIRIEVEGGGGSSGNMILSGLLISASNPYFLLWWAIIGLGFLLEAYKSFGFAGVAVFYLGHMVADFLWYGAISTIIGKTRKFVNMGVYRGIIVALGCLLVYFGGNFVYQAVRSIARA